MKLLFIAKYTAKDLAKRILHQVAPDRFNPLRVGIGSMSARCCYSIWLRHLVMAHRNGLNAQPQVVAEIGPGNSIGVGLAALLSGSERYYGLDIVRFAYSERNLKVFDELVELFRQRAPIPGEDEFPAVKPYLPDYSFPAEVLTEERLERSLREDRISAIRASLVSEAETYVRYCAPWTSSDVVSPGTVDMILSQAVLEHVDDLEDSYRAMALWLKPTGYVSHQIDFKCHATADTWNGHWTHSDLEWKLIRKGAPFLINRQPHSAHLSHLRANSFRVLCDQTVPKETTISLRDVAPRFKSLAETDLTTSGAFIQAAL